MDVESLRKWFISSKRDFPWRENPSPYHVLVSEMMLQQTRAHVVIPYYQRWMERFPSIAALARAKLEEVIKCWEGLGYYSRARALHGAAKVILERHGGEIPSDPEHLSSIKGIGPYTAGAIRSFGFHQKAPAVDGNVLRVCARHFLIEEDISLSATAKAIRERVANLLPDLRPWEISEALIELGALVCKKKPDCPRCPLKANCLARKEQKQEVVPRRKARAEITTLYRTVFLLIHEGYVLIRQNKKGIMKDLWEFPYVERQKNTTLLNEKKIIEMKWKVAPRFVCALPQVTQFFTRYKVHLAAKVWQVEKPLEISSYVWMQCSSLEQLPFSSGHKKLITHFSKELYE